jgi:hypothetical protein
MEWVVLTVWNTLGTQKLRNPPTPKQKQFGPLRVWWLAPLTTKDFYLYGWAHEYVTHLPPINTPSKKILQDEMGWTSTLVRMGSLEFITPSYLPITTFPFPRSLCCIAFFSPLSAPSERSSSKFVELCNFTSFQVSSKFQAMCVVVSIFLLLKV